MEIIFYIILLTVIISYRAFQNIDLKKKLLFNPYLIHENSEYHRLISHIFIHADWTHLMFNMFSLYFLGSYLESSWINYFGTTNALIHISILYVIGGVFSSFILFVKNKKNPYYNSLGASGAVSAVIFAAITWNPELELMLFLIPIPIKAYIFGPIYLIFEYFSMKRGSSNIAHEAHLSGAVFGVIYVFLLVPDKLTFFVNLIF